MLARTLLFLTPEYVRTGKIVKAMDEISRSFALAHLEQILTMFAG